MTTKLEGIPQSRRGHRQVTEGVPIKDNSAYASEDDKWRSSNIGRLLNNAVRRFEATILDKMAAGGHGQCTISHINVTRNLDIQGTRATELARRASMTKQSLGELVAQLETLGMVTRAPDPTDGRAKIVKFTPRGRQWLDQFHAALEASEAELEEELGPSLYKALKKALLKYDSPVGTGEGEL